MDRYADKQNQCDALQSFNAVGWATTMASGLFYNSQE